MKLLVPLVLAGVVAGLIVCVVGTFVLDLVDRLKHRGEVADARCACRTCTQLDEDEVVGVRSIHLDIWEHELTRENQ